jgi:hypothetical protein
MDCWEYTGEEKSWEFGLNFVFGGQRCDENLITLRGLRFGGNFNVNFGTAEWGALQRDVDLGTKTAVALKPGKNTGNLDRFGRLQDFPSLNTKLNVSYI